MVEQIVQRQHVPGLIAFLSEHDVPPPLHADRRVHLAIHLQPLAVDRVTEHALFAALRASVLTQLNAMDEGTLSNLLRNAAGAHAEEVAMQILANARASEIRSKASAVLQRLRAGG